MKLFVPFALFMAVGCILITGCVNETKPDNDSKNVSLQGTFAPFSVPGTEGPLKISISGLVGEYPAYIDNISVGLVSAKRPVTLMKREGNYFVQVCCGEICEHENVTVRFGRERTVDLSEQLKKELGSSGPVARISEYYQGGNQITVIAEFINPTTKPLTMSAEVSCGYSFIEGINYNRVRNIAQGHFSVTVNPCDHEIKTLNFDLVSGSSYMYDIPTITYLSSK